MKHNIEQLKKKLLGQQRLLINIGNEKTKKLLRLQIKLFQVVVETRGGRFRKLRRRFRFTEVAEDQVVLAQEMELLGLEILLHILEELIIMILMEQVQVEIEDQEEK